MSRAVRASESLFRSSIHMQYVKTVWKATTWFCRMITFEFNTERAEIEATISAKLIL